MLCEKCHQVDVEGELVLSCDDCSDGYGTAEYICAGNIWHCFSYFAVRRVYVYYNLCFLE